MNEKNKQDGKFSRGKTKDRVFNNKLSTALVPPVLREVGKLAVGVASVSTASGSATGKISLTYQYLFVVDLVTQFVCSGIVNFSKFRKSANVCVNSDTKWLNYMICLFLIVIFSF